MTINNNLQLQSKQTSTIENSKQNLGKSLSLKTKTTLLAIAIGVIPVATVGLLAYTVLNRSLTREISLYKSIA